MKKRILSLTVCLCLCLSLLPAAALADDAPHTHCICGQEAADAHADPYTAHDDTISWTAWTESDSLPTASGNYYLTQDVTLTQWWDVEAEVALCLNGHKIIGADGAGPIYVVPGAKLSVTDCAGGGQIAVPLEGDDSSALTVNGGQLGQVGLYGGAMSLAGGQIEMLYAAGGSLSLTGGELGVLMVSLLLQITQIEACENVTITGQPGEDFLPAGTDVAIVIMGTDYAEVTGIADALEAKVADGGGTLMNGTAPAERLTQVTGDDGFGEGEGYVIVYAAPLTIHTPEPEAKWGADADSLDSKGTLLEALDAAKDSGAKYIQLVKDVTAPDEQTFTATAGEFTLDLNGHTLTGGKGKENAQEDPTLQMDYQLSQAATGKTGLIIDGANVTLTDARKSGGVTGGTGGHYSRNDSGYNGRGGIGVYVKSGELTVESGVTLTHGDPGSRYAGITLGLSALDIAGGTVTLNGGTYDSRAKTVGDATQNGFSAIDVCGSEADLTVPEGADVTAMGNGGISIAIDSGTVDIAAGSFTGELYGLMIGSSELTATVQLSGGTYTATRANGCAVNVYGSVTHAQLLAEGYCFADGDGDPVADGDLATAKTLTVVNPFAPEPPTVIPDLETLALFRDCVNKGETYEGKTVTLTADIDLGGEDNPWEPIGMDGAPFTGTFDGGGHTVTGLYINNTESNLQGLFGYVGQGGTVKNLGVSGTVSGCQYVGGVVGCNGRGTVENCHYSGAVSGDSAVSGVVGSNEYGAVTGCYNTGAVTGDSVVGGVVGLDVGAVENCYNTGTVSGADFIGGVVGGPSSLSKVTNCYNTGTVLGDSHVGSVAGSDLGAVENCYYLDTCQAAGDGTSKTAAQFASGEVAHLLQGDQQAQAWGQTLGTDGEPLLTAEAAKRVYKVTFQVDSEEYAVAYANTGGTVALPTDAPTPPEGYQFDKWAIGSVSGEGFTAATPITQDLTVYAVMKNVPTHTHDWAADWTSNDTHHWHQCAADGCDVAEDSGKDSYGEHTYSGYETSDAQHWQKCSVCQRETAKADHTWDEGVVTVEPTLEAEGAMTYTCAVCGETKTQPMDKLTPSATPSRPHSRPVAAAQPVEQTPAVWPLTDVTEQDWCYDGVKYVYDAKLMEGISEAAFAPDLYTSRAMVTTILWRLAGSLETEAALPYPDCEADSWYAAAVAWGTEEGVVKGYDSGNFGPDDPITREQMALMLWRYAGSPETTGTLSTFTDGGSVSPWVFPAMEWAVDQGIITGRGGGLLDPQGLATRAEAAAMLQRFCKDKG